MRRFVPLTALLLALGLLAPATASTPSGAIYDTELREESPVAGGHERPSFDARSLVEVAPLPSAVKVATALRRSVPDLSVTWDVRTGVAKHVFSDASMLTGGAGGMVSAAHARRIARGWLDAHRGLFGLAASDTLTMVRDSVLPSGGPFDFIWRVHYEGFATVAGGTVGVNVTRDGRILSATASTGPSAKLNTTTPGVSALQAIAAVAHREGVTDFTPVVHAASASRRDRLTIFQTGGLAERHNARLAALPTATGPKLVWRVFLAIDEDAWMVDMVDAVSGKVVYSTNLVNHVAEGNVFENHPGAPQGGEQKMQSFDGDPAASPRGWLGLPQNGQTVGAVSTIGNNAFAWTDIAQYKLQPTAGVSGVPGVPGVVGIQANGLPEFAPVSPTGQFNAAFQDSWNNSCSPTTTPAAPKPAIPPGIPPTLPDGLPTLPAIPGVPNAPTKTVESPAYLQDAAVSVTNIFWLVNRLHDLSYKLGFDEAHGNFQQDNFGKGGKGMDAVRYQAMAGALNNRLNNANMATPPDGGEPADFIETETPDGTARTITSYIPPRGNMYLWRPTTKISTIRCSDGDFDASVAWHEYTHGITNRMVGGPDDSGSVSGPQGGAMGEAWSDFVALHFLTVLGFEKRAIVGPYTTGNEVRGIRNFPPAKSPLTYGDFGWGLGGPQVHNDGEIWMATLWDLRSALLKTLGKTRGEQVTGQLTFDSFAIGPRLPSFLDMRDAILASDRARYRGKHQALIWSVFAKRGMGKSAKTKGSEDLKPTPAYDVPGSGNAAVKLTVTDIEGGVLPKAKVVVSGFGQGSGLPTAIAAASGVATFKLAPGSYVIRAGGPGYGMQPAGQLSVSAGQTITSTARLTKNLASLSWGGAVISGLEQKAPEPRLPDFALLDDRDATSMTVPGDAPVVLKLGGSGPATIRSILIHSRGGAGLMDYKVETSLNGSAWKAFASARRAFKRGFGAGDYPPLALAGRSVKARYIRITGVSTTLDLIDSVVPSFTLNDIQVYGSAPGLKTTARGLSAPFVEEGMIQVASENASTAGAAYTTFSQTCGKPPAPLNGVDGYVVQLPAAAADGMHLLEIINKGGDGTDLDGFIYNSKCALIANAATSAASEYKTLPAGSKWVLVTLYQGTTTGFTVGSKTTLEPGLRPKG